MDGLTTGRVVHYYASPSEYPIEGTCLAATIAHVWNASTGTVNLSVLDSNGMSHSRTSIQHVDHAPKGAASWHWPERA